MEFSLVEMMVIVFVALLLYGGRLPRVAMAVGRALGEFKRGLRETSDMVRFEIQEADRVTAQPSARPPEPSPDRYGDAEPAEEELAREDISIEDEPVVAVTEEPTQAADEERGAAETS